MSIEGKGRVPSQPLCDDRPLCDQRKRRGVVYLIVGLALLLAIGFFFIAEKNKQDARSTAVTKAAEKIDDAAQSVGDAAGRAFDRLRNERRKPE